MANLALCRPDGTIIRFIKDCVKVSNSVYVGSNCKIKGCKNAIEKWTLDEAFPLYNIKGHVIGWDRNAEDLSEMEKFEGEVAENSIDVNKIIRNKIAEKYSIEDELKLHRMKLEGTIDDKVWNEYVSYVNDLITKGEDAKTSLDARRV